MVPPGFRIPSAHIVYLSLLAKFGIVGFLIYGSFIFFPLVYVFRRGKSLEEQYRYLISAIYLALIVMYIWYDYFLFLEFQYIVIGIVYSIIINKLGIVDQQVPAARPDPWGKPVNVDSLANSQS